MKCVAIFLLFVCAVLAAPQQEQQPLKILENGNRLFAAKLYKDVIKKSKDNLIFSPFSAETVLALLSEGARGETRDELFTGLGLSSNARTNQEAFKEFLPKLKSDSDNLKLLSANKIYANSDVKLEEEYEKIAKDIYDSSIENVDFSNNEAAADTINQWVEAQTNNKIKELIKSDAIGADTKLILINALYLNAKWVHKFSDAEEGTFFNYGKEETSVAMMSKVEFYKYHNNTELGVQFLEIPYKGNGLSMIIALPYEKEGLASLEEKIEQVLAEQPLQSTRVQLEMPKFKAESEMELQSILQNMGIRKIFGNGDLSGLSSTHKGIGVSSVLQKAFINVTETGTEATAATSISLARILYDRRPKEKVVDFVADHPFIYFIKKDSVIMFVGTVTKLPKFEYP